MNRRGISLVELLVVMSGCSIVLSTSAVLIHRAMRAQLATRHFFDQERAAQRLSRQFRADIREAANVESDPEQLDSGAVVRISRPGDGSIEYRREANLPGTIIRMHQPESGAARREEFNLGSRVQVAAQRLDGPDRLVLAVTAEDAPVDPAASVTAKAVREAPSELRVEAVIGRERTMIERVRAVDEESGE